MMPTNAGSAAFATAIVDDTAARKYATTAQACCFSVCTTKHASHRMALTKLQSGEPAQLRQQASGQGW